MQPLALDCSYIEPFTSQINSQTHSCSTFICSTFLSHVRGNLGFRTLWHVAQEELGIERPALPPESRIAVAVMQ